MYSLNATHRGQVSRKRRATRCRRGLEQLEARQLLAVTAADDLFVTVSGHDLVVGSDTGGSFQQLELVDSYAAGGNAVQLEYAPQYQKLFLRNSRSQVRVVDVATKSIISTQRATEQFTDFDLTPDGRYLFAADYGGTEVGYGTPARPSWIHRYDVQANTWSVQQAATIAWKIEAVSADRVLLQEQDQHVSMMLNRFDGGPSPTTELSRIGANYYGDFEYDHRTGRIFHGNSGSSSPEIHVRKLENDSLRWVSSSGTYGTAQGSGGTVVLASDGSRFYYGSLQVDAADVTHNLRVFPSPIHAATGSVAFAENVYYDARTGTELGSLPFGTSVYGVSDDGQHLVAFRGSDDTVWHYRVATTGYGVLENDRDAFWNVLSAEIQQGPQHGQLTAWASDGTLRYRPDAGFVGTDSFSYLARNAAGESAPATVTITVNDGGVANRAPTVVDKSFAVDVGQTLQIDAASGQLSAGLYAADTWTSSMRPAQMKYSDLHQLLFLRSANDAIQVVDAVTHSVLDTREAVHRFTDMDLSPSGRYLFAADYGGETSGDPPAPPSVIHRYDLQTQTWESKIAPAPPVRLEAVDDERVVLLPGSQSTAVSLQRFGAAESPMQELSRLPANLNGDIEYDPVSGRVLHGNGGSSSHEIAAFRVEGDSLAAAESTGMYGTAQGHGGTVVLSSGGNRLYYGNLQVEATDVRSNTNVFPEMIQAASDRLAVGTLGVYSADSRRELQRFDFVPRALHLSDTGQTLWAYDDEGGAIHRFNVFDPLTGILAGDLDADGDPLVAELVTPPAHGALSTFNPDGTVVYVPDAGFSGIDSFTYRAFDGQLYSDPATVRIQVVDPNPVRFPPIARGDRYQIAEDETLTIVAPASSGQSVTLLQLSAIDLTTEKLVYSPESGEMTTTSMPAEQLVYSPQHGLLVSRTGNQVTVLDAQSHAVVGTHAGIDYLSDMDLSPDGRYLFVADYGGTYTGYGTPIRPSHVHRLDLAAGTWMVKQAPKVAWKIEALDGDRVLLLEQDQWVELTLNSFAGMSGMVMQELSRISSNYAGDIEYDPRSLMVYHGNSGVSSHEIHVFRVNGNSLTPVQQTETYGSAQGYGGSTTLATDGMSFYYGGLRVEAADVVNNLGTYPESIVAATPQLAFSKTSYYDVASGTLLGSLPAAVDMLTVSADGRHLWTFGSGQLSHYELDSRAGGILENDTDMNGDLLSAHLIQGPSHGQVQLDASGAFVYTPAPGFAGVDEFTYGARDGAVVSDPATVAIMVGHGWHHFVRPLDVDKSGSIVSLDALLVINELNEPTHINPINSRFIGSRPSDAAFLDVNDDDYVSPLDVLLIINYLSATSVPDTTPPQQEVTLTAQMSMPSPELQIPDNAWAVWADESLKLRRARRA